MAAYWDIYCEGTPSRIAINKLMHALIFEAMKSFGEETASEVHAARLKPFTISPPFRVGKFGAMYFYEGRAKKKEAALSGQLGVRVTFAGPREAFALAALASSPERRVRKVDGGAVKLGSFSAGEVWVPEAAKVFWDRDARVEFLSPVVFKNGRNTRCLPDAALLARSLANRIAGFGLSGISDVLEEEGVWSRIKMRDAFLSTREFIIWDGVCVQGAVGRMTLGLDSRCSERGRRAWAVLMSLAPYVGVGCKTGFGAGQVAVEPA